MDRYQNNFKRYEKKYIIDEEQYRQLMAMIYCRLKYDRYRRYRICNIYFDTPDYELIRTSLDKPLYKEKLRLRSYGTPQREDNVFLEIKKKYRGVVYKRRISLPYEQAAAWCLEGKEPEREGQIERELKWFMDRYSLIPRLYLSYDRLAMTGLDDDSLRITFDTNLVWRTTELSLTAGDFGTVSFPEGRYIMEIKVPYAMPLWLTSALSQLKIYPVSYSKYGSVYSGFLLQAQAADHQPEGEKEKC
ncbi:MAG: polyphosphate polymerase domain-containing protein [Emergencia sp.]